MTQKMKKTKDKKIKKIQHRKSKNKTIKKTKKIKPSVKQKMERIPSYIPNFDSLIESGFPKNSTILVVGGSGSGKTIFATQLLIGAMKKGEKCLYVTFEEKKDRFYKNMKRFGWDLDAYEKKDLFTFLEYTPSKVKTMLEEGGGEIEQIILRKKISRMVIDSITSFALLFEKELEKREAALDLFNMIYKWNCTSFLTIESEPNEDQPESRALEFEADGIILLYSTISKNQRERYLEILKMRGTDHSKKMYKFHVGSSGVIVDKNPSNPSN